MMLFTDVSRSSLFKLTGVSPTRCVGIPRRWKLDACHCIPKTREVLSTSQRMKENTDLDSEFYAYPRLVNHADAGFIQSLRLVYEEYLTTEKINLDGTQSRDSIVILDLASSHVSHMPDIIASSPMYSVIGHGMNAEELQRNPLLDRYFIRDFNKTADDPWALNASSVDAVCICCSVQYFQYPEKIFAEIYRVLRPGGVVIVSFTNRMFWEKAIKAWRDLNDYGRVQLVKQYIMSVMTEDGQRGFSNPVQVEKPQTGVLRQGKSTSWISQISSFLFPNKDPFYCVVAYKIMQ